MKKMGVFHVICSALMVVVFSGCWNNKSKEMRVKTNSGLMFEVLNEGDLGGTFPQKGQWVTVHYDGWLSKNNFEKGEMFDSSRKRGEPFRFQLGMGRVIKGWDQGVASMKVGEKRRLIIPAHLGYGKRGTGPIPPNATLIFEVELLQVA